jgi:hypothetical protein
MAIKTVKSLFYESPKPIEKKALEETVVITESPLKSRIKNIIDEGVMFGAGPKLYGTGQAKIGQSLGGGGGYAGGITKNRQPGETQFGIIEEEDDDMNLDAVAKEMDAQDSATPEENAETPTDTSTEETPTDNSTEETPTDDTNTDESSTEDAPEDAPIDTTPPEPQETPEQKITKMFADTGDVDADYGLNNENNIRLEKFKFTNAGIDLKTLIPEDDLKTGISSKEVVNLLTPSQRDLFKTKNKELRKTYPLIDTREKNIIIHNSNVPISSNQNGVNVEISSDMKRQAYSKINAYLEANFSKSWQDKSKAIDFLRTIKVNFSETPAIRANLIDLGSMISEEGENYKIPLDKVNVLIPSTVHDFIKLNKEDPIFSKSNIFRTFTSVFNQEAGTTGQVCIIFNSENIQEAGEEGASEEESIEEPPKDTEGDTGSGAPEDTAAEGGEEGVDDDSDVLENAVDALPTE